MRFNFFLRRLLFGLVIAGLLFLGSFAYFELNKEKLLADFKIFVQAQLSKSTGKTVTFGNLAGGILSGITLDKLVISRADKENNLLPVFEAEHLILNYRYWDIILGRFDRLRYIRLDRPVFYFNDMGVGDSAKRDKQSGFAAANLLSWLKAKNKISIFINNGSLAWDKKYILFSDINGRILYAKDSLQCPLLEGRILGANIDFKGLITKLDQPLPQIDLSLVLDGDWAKGFCRAQDALSEPTLIGAFNLGQETRLDFTGKVLTERGGINLKNFLINNQYILNANINLSKKDGYLVVEDENKNDILATALSLYSDYSFLSQTKFNHFKLLGHDLSTNLVIMGNWPSGEPKTFSAYMASSGTIIDYNPANELEATFQILDKTLTISSFKFGSSYQISGTAGLSLPCPLDLTLTINEGQVSDLLVFAKNKKEASLGGQFDGQVKLSGFFPDNLEINGRLEGHNGNIGTIKYETANLNLKSSGSLIYVEGSRVFRPGEGKYLTLDGFIDLAKLGSGNLLQDLRVSSDEKTIIWSGWDITKKPEDTKLSFKKDVGSEFKVGFDTFINDETANDLKKDKGAVELQYNLSQEQSIKLKLKENEEMVGVEHKVEF